MPWCPNSHEVDANTPYCPRCGKPTVLQCRHGHQFGMVIDPSTGAEYRPDYCPRCGEAYPWAASSSARR